MSVNFDIAENLKKKEIPKREKRKLIRLYEFTQYLFDNDENLTKTMNLKKGAREELLQRIDELFDSA